jgi:hypothetical protein
MAQRRDAGPRDGSVSDGLTSGTGFGAYLWGAWTLVSYAEVPGDGSGLRYPLGPDAKGILIYSPDGYMSVQIMRCGRRPFASGDWFSASEAEIREASAFIAYAGTFSVDEEAGTVTHAVDISFFPNWLRRMEVRNVRVSGDELVLVPRTAIRSGGADVMPQLRWSRVSPNDFLAAEQRS